MAIGERLKALRISSGESLQQVADAIGASKAHIWELESNKSKNPSLDLLRKIATHFETTVSYLIDEKEGGEKADAFFRRNQNKFEGLDVEEEAIVQSLLDRFADVRKNKD